MPRNLCVPPSTYAWPCPRNIAAARPTRTTLARLDSRAEVEPLPAFRPPERNGLCFSVITGIVLVVALADWVRGRHESAIVFIACHLPGLALTALCMTQERWVRAWFDRHYARKVVRGIAELEARAAR